MRIISSVAALAPADHVESDGCMAIDRLLPVAKLALERAELQAADIDLIVTLSLSPDRLAVDPAIIGPRIGHPMQRALGAERAYLFDLMDSSLAKALHVIDVFAQVQGYRRVLVLRSEFGGGLNQAASEVLRIPDGAAALVVAPDGKSRFARVPLAGVDPLVFMLRPNIRHPLDVKADLRFARSAGFDTSYQQATATALAQLDAGSVRQVAESWFSAEQAGPGPFTLPLILNQLLTKSGIASLVIISFDPFGPAIDVANIELGASVHV